MCASCVLYFEVYSIVFITTVFCSTLRSYNWDITYLLLFTLNGVYVFLIGTFLLLFCADQLIRSFRQLSYLYCIVLYILIPVSLFTTFQHMTYTFSALHSIIYTLLSNCSSCSIYRDLFL